MLERNRCALKEWASICDRLARGEQVFVIRKGGILERRDGFEVEHREFFLFPTRFHERGDAPPGSVTLSIYATVEKVAWVDDLERARRLQGHGLPAGDVEKRFRYGRRPGVHALALRAYRLSEPKVVADARAYDGCRSWVELAEELPVGAAEPALDADAFRSGVAKLEAILEG